MKKKLKFLIPIVLVVLIGVAAALYCLTDLFKSPKTLFFKYLGKAVESSSEYSYDDFLEELKFYNELACTTSSEITIDAKLSDAEEETLDIINNSKISLTTKQSPKSENSYVSIENIYDSKTLSLTEFLESNNNYGLKNDDIYKKYFYIENKNLKKLYEKYNLDSDDVPDSFSKINIYDLLYIDSDTRNSITKRYSEILNSNLDKDSFSTEKNTDIKVNGKKVSANAYTLTLKEKDLCNLLIPILKELKDDDETLDLFLEKYNMILKDYSDFNLSKSDIIEELEKTIDSLETSKDSFSSGKIKLTVYESKGKTVKFEIKSGVEIIAIDITRTSKEGTICLYAEVYDEVVFSIKNEYKINKDKITSKVTLQTDITSIELNLEITGENLDNKPTKFNYTGFLNIISNEDTDYIKLNINGKVEYTDSVKIPDLGTSNGICLNTVSNDELNTIKSDVNTNLNTFIDKVLETFNFTRTDLGLPSESINFFE